MKEPYSIVKDTKTSRTPNIQNMGLNRDASQTICITDDSMDQSNYEITPRFKTRLLKNKLILSRNKVGLCIFKFICRLYLTQEIETVLILAC